jgi:hypothetical protein
LTNSIPCDIIKILQERRKRKEFDTMMCACELAIVVEEKRKAEEEARRLAELKRLNEAMEEFKRNLEKIDAYVEKHLIAGNGKAELMIEKRYGCPDGFYSFAEKDYRYSSTKPYWCNNTESEKFPLEVYIKYLQEHCYKVSIVECPFTAYSASFKSSQQMEGLTLKISM